ncbi:MAG: choice-of-anchor R domain-containing protein [bacterium]
MKTKSFTPEGFTMFRSLACSVALAAAALLFTVATGEAQSQQYVYGNYGTVAASFFSATVGYVTGIQNNTLVSQGFTTGTGQWDIKQIDVALASGTGVSDARVYLFDDNAGVPGSILATYALLNGPLTNSMQTHFFSGSYVASPDTSYWLVTGDANSISQQSSFEWYLEDTGATPRQQNSSGFIYLGTKVQNYTGAEWTDTLPGLSLRVNAVAVPEPSTYAFASMAGMLAAGAAARKKFAAKR